MWINVWIKVFVLYLNNYGKFSPHNIFLVFWFYSSASSNFFSIFYLSICFILARPLTHKSNTGHLNTICLPSMKKRMGWRELNGGSMAHLTVSLLSHFHIHLPFTSSLITPCRLVLFFSLSLFSSKPDRALSFRDQFRHSWQCQFI